MKLILTDDTSEIGPGVMLFSKSRLAEILAYISSDPNSVCRECGMGVYCDECAREFMDASTSTHKDENRNIPSPSDYGELPSPAAPYTEGR